MGNNNPVKKSAISISSITRNLDVNKIIFDVNLVVNVVPRKRMLGKLTIYSHIIIKLVLKK